MQFIVDGMLGKLVRWLRMMGHDVDYFDRMDDSELLTKAKKEHKILLTRDFQLYQQGVAKEVDAYYVEGQTEEERLAELAKRFNIKLEVDMATSRCPRCNTPVKLISKEKVVFRVEKNTFDHYTNFWQCPNCCQVYWQGAHWTKIRETLKTAEKNLQRQRKGSV